jgi:hypothetical protein
MIHLFTFGWYGYHANTAVHLIRTEQDIRFVGSLLEILKKMRYSCWLPVPVEHARVKWNSVKVVSVGFKEIIKIDQHPDKIERMLQHIRKDTAVKFYWVGILFYNVVCVDEDGFSIAHDPVALSPKAQFLLKYIITVANPTKEGGPVLIFSTVFDVHILNKKRIISGGMINTPPNLRTLSLKVFTISSAKFDG